jgi:hypothetical protein
LANFKEPFPDAAGASIKEINYRINNQIDNQKPQNNRV